MTLLTWLIFLFFALVTVVSACIVAFSRNIVRSTFALLATFTGVAVLFAFLGADFLFAVQIIVYVGGILVLILFAIMLTSEIVNVKLSNKVAPNFAIFLVLLVFSASIIGFLFSSGILDVKATQKNIIVAPITKKIGLALLDKYLFPFEVASLLLLVALIGAVYMASSGSNNKQVSKQDNK